MEYCRCCVKDVSDQAEKKQRRLLSSATMQTTLQTLKDFVSKLQADEKLDDIEDGFICRECVRLLERFRKVNEEVVCNVVKVLPLLRAAKSQREESDTFTPSTRLPSCSSTSLPPAASASQIQCSHDTSPPVTVNGYIVYCINYGQQ